MRRCTYLDCIETVVQAGFLTSTCKPGDGLPFVVSVLDSTFSPVEVSRCLDKITVKNTE